jgi:hypothetical protein
MHSGDATSDAIGTNALRHTAVKLSRYGCDIKEKLAAMASFSFD